jgi:hypothetical protein
MKTPTIKEILKEAEERYPEYPEIPTDTCMTTYHDEHYEEKQIAFEAGAYWLAEKLNIKYIKVTNITDPNPLNVVNIEQNENRYTITFKENE